MLLLIGSLGAIAQNGSSELTNKVFKQLGISSDEVSNELFVIEEISETESFLVVPIIIPYEEYLEYDVKILIAESKTGKIISRFPDSVFWVSDALRLSEISVRYKPYEISTDSETIGIYLDYYGGSRVNPYFSNNLFLFEREGNKLKLILEDFMLHQLIGENDGWANGSYQELKRIIEPLESAQNYPDLRIRQVILRSETVDGEEEILRISNRNIAVLKYSNGSYKTDF